MTSPSLSRTVQLLFLFFLVIAGLYFAKPFLVPLVIAGILAMLFLPVTQWLEGKGFHPALAAVSCVLILLSVVAVIVSLLSWQVGNLAEDMTGFQEQLGKTITKLKEYIAHNLGISQQKQQEMMKEQQSAGSGNAGKMVTSILSSGMSILVDTILVLVYIFLFLYLRNHLKKFILMLVPQSERPQAKKVITESTTVARSYLAGMGMMIAMLWVLYGIGFSIVGVKSAIFFAMLCGLLEIIPFIGNLTGTALTMLMALSQGADSKVVIGILVTYAIIQFVQTYLLEPLVVGSKVKINPLVCISCIVLGELIWGIPGMILAIPIVGICKIIFDNIESLKPYGFLLGEEQKPAKK